MFGRMSPFLYTDMQLAALRTRKSTLTLLSLFLALAGALGAVLLSGSQSAEAQEEPPATPEQMLAELQKQWTENQTSHEDELRAIEREHRKEQLQLHETANEIRNALCEQGKKEYCPKEDIKGKYVDLDKLAYAVAMAETGDCTASRGSALLNNCHGFKVKGKFLAFKTKEESYEYFKKMWLRNYGDRFPTSYDARRYTAGTGERWLNVVTTVYNKQ